MPQFNVEQLLATFFSPLARSLRKIYLYVALVIPNWPFWQSINAISLRKMVAGEIFVQINTQDNNTFQTL